MAGYILMQVSTPLVETIGTQNKAEVIALVGDIFKGADAPQLQIQYSTNGASWHTTWVSGDIYLRTSANGGTTWSGAILFIQDVSLKVDKNGNELNTIAEAECSADERLARLENFVRKLVKGDVICDKITTRELNLQGTTSLVRKGAGAPTTAPDYIGQFYVNTTNGDYYKSTGNESVSNWVIL